MIWINCLAPERDPADQIQKTAQDDRARAPLQNKVIKNEKADNQKAKPNGKRIGHGAGVAGAWYSRKARRGTLC